MIEFKPVHPNAGATAHNTAQVTHQIDAMHRDLLNTVLPIYWEEQPAILATDESPVERLKRAMEAFSNLWLRKFDRFSEKFAGQSTRRAADHVNRNFKGQLREAGFTVKFQLTPIEVNVIQAAVAENVSLIRSIPEQYLKSVEGSVMRAVMAGRDLFTLGRELQEIKGVTARRAQRICIDQNRKVTSAITRARMIESGAQAKWRHSGAPHVPRPSHVAFDGKFYDPKKGAFIEGEYIQPAEKPGCGCIGVAVFKNLSRRG